MALGDDAGAAVGIGASLATGNFVGAAIGAIGLGTSLFGSMGQAKVSKEESQLSAANAGYEEDIDKQRQQQMVLTSRRQQLENFRNTQRARAQGLNASVNQGAQFGTGMLGGQAQAADQGNYNSLGISQNLGIGQSIFGFNEKIDANKIQLASLGGDAATYAGYSAIGGDISKAATPLGNLFGGFGSSSKASGGDYTGMPWSQNTGNLY